MKLPKLPFKDKAPQSNYFLTLTLTKEKADAVIFEETLQKIKVSGHSSEYFDSLIDEVSEEKLLNVLDRVISTAEKNLPENIQTQKTIFGVDHSWVENGKITKDYLLKLKKISQELELTPVGFIVNSEAIAHLLQKEEGAPVSALLTEIGKKYLTITLIRGGRIIESKTSEIMGSTAETVDELLKHLTTPEVLPSRIILLGEKVSDLNQEFLSYSWSKSLPFLHVPQIMPLSEFFDSKSILNGAATQMGFVVSDISALSKTEIPQDFTNDFEPDKPEKVEEENTEEFGFMEGADVSKSTPKEMTSPIAPNIPPEVLNKEIEEIPEEIKINQSDKKSFPLNALLLFSGIKKFTPKLMKLIRIPKVNSTFLKGPGKFLLIPGGLILILLLLFVYFLLFRSAVVTIGVSAKDANKTEDVTFSTKSPTSIDDNTIKSEFTSVSEDGKLTAQATGKKQTGDKAHGTVTIFNLSSTPKTFASGTTITSPNNLSFTFDKGITIASGSGDATSPNPGKTDVSVTASAFGTQYNLPSGTKFSVADNPTALIAGKNDNAFSGGTVKDIVIVSNDDLNNLSSDMVKSLEDKAKNDISKKASGDTVVLPDFVSTSFDLKSFSKKSGDEATSVSLTATVTYQAITYSKKDLDSYAQSLFQKDLGKDLIISEENTSVDVQNLKKKDDSNTTATLNIQTKLFPKIDTQSLVHDLAGKSFNDATDIISHIPQSEGVKINLSPGIFFFPKILPSSPSKIKIQVNKNV